MNSFKSVDEYIDSFPLNVKLKLQEMKKIIKKVIPDGDEIINYNIPAITIIKNGKRDDQIMFAGYKKHIGLYPHPSTMVKFEKELLGYKTGKGSVQFSITNELPVDLIIKMISYRKKIVEEKYNGRN